MTSIDVTLQQISRMKRDDGIRHLSGSFHWTEFDDDVDDKRQYLHQLFVYEIVMYAIKRGLSWATVGQVARVTKDLLPKLKGLRTSDAVGVIRDQLSQIEPRLSTAHHAVLLDFILRTYVPHQRLYQAFLHGDNGLKHISCDLKMKGPPHPPPLCEGTDAEEQEQQHILKETRTEREEVREKTEAQMLAKLKDTLNHLPLEGKTMSRQEVEELLHSFLRSQGQIMMECLMEEAKLTDDLLHLILKSQQRERLEKRNENVFIQN